MEKLSSVQPIKLCGQSFGGYPHGFALHISALNHFLLTYHRFYTNYRNRHLKPWLPHTWETATGESKVAASLQAMQLQLIGKPDTLKLVIRVSKGTFTAGADTFEMAGWTIRLSTPFCIERVPRVTADPLPYYKQAFEKIERAYNRPHQLAMDLQAMDRRPADEDLDLKGAVLNPAQKAALLAHIEALMLPDADREKFVFLYLGASAKVEPSLWSAELLVEPLSNAAVTKAVFFPLEFRVSCPPGAPEEIHIAYTSPCCKRPGGTGTPGKPLISRDREGTFLLGRNSLFTCLSSVEKSMIAVMRGESVDHIRSSEQSFPAIGMRVGRVNAGDRTILGWKYDFNFRDTFRLPVLGGNGETYPVEIRLYAPRTYETELKLGENAILTETTLTGQPGDKWYWKDHVNGEIDLGARNPELLESIRLGEWTPGMRESFMYICLDYPRFCNAIIQAYQLLLQQAHAIYLKVQQMRDWRLANLNMELSGEKFFIQIPEMFTCQNLRFDEQWNLLFDIRMVRTSKGAVVAPAPTSANHPK